MPNLITEARKLEVQIRADDRAITCDWYVDGETVRARTVGSHLHYGGRVPVAMSSGPDYGGNLPIITRTRNALPVLADTLRDLCAEVERLSSETERLADEDTERYRLRERVKELESGLHRAFIAGFEYAQEEASIRRPSHYPYIEWPSVSKCKAAADQFAQKKEE